MSERAQEIGLLMGDEDPRLSQTALAEREAEVERIPVPGVPVEGEEAAEGETVGEIEEPEEEEEELDDSAPLVQPSGKRGGDDDLIPTSPLGGLRATMTDDGEIVVDEVIDDEIPVAGAVEEEEEDQGYVLEEDDEETAEEEEEDEGPLAHSTDDDY
jgi:hypothetical protein